jgi:hypothetical protein
MSQCLSLEHSEGRSRRGGREGRGEGEDRKVRDDQLLTREGRRLTYQRYTTRRSYRVECGARIDAGSNERETWSGGSRRATPFPRRLASPGSLSLISAASTMTFHQPLPQTNSHFLFPSKRLVFLLSRHLLPRTPNDPLSPFSASPTSPSTSSPTLPASSSLRSTCQSSPIPIFPSHTKVYGKKEDSFPTWLEGCDHRPRTHRLLSCLGPLTSHLALTS